MIVSGLRAMNMLVETKHEDEISQTLPCKGSLKTCELRVMSGTRDGFQFAILIR